MFETRRRWISAQAIYARRFNSDVERAGVTNVKSSSVALREFRFPDDYDAVIRFWESIEKGMHISASDAPAEIQKKIQRDPDLFLVAELNHEIVGAVIGGFDGRRGMIYHLAVAASFRGQGIGARLMSEVETRLRAKGCLKCYLIVLRDNDDAMKFYERIGWESMDRDVLYGKEFAMSLRFGVLTVSDRSARGERPDASGPALIEMVKRQGWEVIHRSILPDDLNILRELLENWSDRDDVDVIFNDGWNGLFSARCHAGSNARGDRA